MAWYRTGTVSVANGSTLVTGVGTAWVANAQIGQALQGPDGKGYEIAAVVSDTALTLATSYLGSSASGQGYAIMPTASFARDLAVSAASLLNSFAAVRDGVGAGLNADGTIAVPGIRFAADQDTGIYRPYANALGIAAGGLAGLTVAASGTTAIGSMGTGSWSLRALPPGGATGQRGGLSLYATFGTGADVSPRKAADISAGMTPGWGAEFLDFGVGTNAANDAGAVTSTRMRIQGDGKVGIGTLAPGSQFVVVAPTDAVMQVHCSDASASFNTSIVLTNQNNPPGYASIVRALDGVAYFYQSDAKPIYLSTSGITRTIVEATGNLRPGADNAYTLGSASFRWSTVYAATGTINTSDERAKTDIIPTPLGLDFINSLQPVSYRYKVGSVAVELEPDGVETVEVTPAVHDANGGIVRPAVTEQRQKVREKLTDVAGTRRHHGLIAQQVKVALGGVDFAGWTMDDPANPGSAQGLRYDQFIAPLIKAVQELAAANAALTSTIATLSARVSALEAAPA